MIEECLVVEFSVTGDDCPLATATRTTGAAVDCEPPQLRTDDNALLRFSVEEPRDDDAGGAAREDVTAGVDGAAQVDEETQVDGAARVGEVLDADDRVRYLHAARGRDRATYRCLSRDPCVVHELTDAGFLVDRLRYRDGTERYTGAVVGYDVLQGVLAAAGEAVGVTLERAYPLGEDDEGAVARGWNLTPAQEAAIRTAHGMGYFSVPKAATAAEVAAELDISKSAFLERLRRGQAALFGQLFV